MFEKADKRNQRTLAKHNRGDKPLVSDGAAKWSSRLGYLYLGLFALILIGVAVGRAVA